MTPNQRIIETFEPLVECSRDCTFRRLRDGEHCKLSGKLIKDYNKEDLCINFKERQKKGLDK